MVRQSYGRSVAHQATHISGASDAIASALALAAIPSPISKIASGIICMWTGLIANIPSGWLLCDGGSGTPDLRSRFLRGAPAATEAGTTGGSDTHQHAAAGGHTHASGGAHAHDYGAGVSHPFEAPYNYTMNVLGAHTHNTIADHQHASLDSKPAYYHVLFIKLS